MKKINIILCVAVALNLIMTFGIIYFIVKSSDKDSKWMIINSKDALLRDEKFRCLDETGKTDCNYVKDLEEQIKKLHEDYVNN